MLLINRQSIHKQHIVAQYSSIVGFFFELNISMMVFFESYGGQMSIMELVELSSWWLENDANVMMNHNPPND